MCSKLFPRKLQKVTGHGRSSDLFPLLSAFPKNKSSVAMVFFQRLWNLQQRDCPGFTPDSLLIVPSVMEVANQCETKIRIILINRNKRSEIYRINKKRWRKNLETVFNFLRTSFLLLKYFELKRYTEWTKGHGKTFYFHYISYS